MPHFLGQPARSNAAAARLFSARVGSSIAEFRRRVLARWMSEIMCCRCVAIVLRGAQCLTGRLTWASESAATAHVICPQPCLWSHEVSRSCLSLLHTLRRKREAQR